MRQALLVDLDLRRAQEMATLAEIGNDIAASRELIPILERIAAHVMSVLNVRDIAIRLLDADGKSIYTPVALGLYPEQIKASVLRLGEGLTGITSRLTVLNPPFVLNWTPVLRTERDPLRA